MQDLQSRMRHDLTAAMRARDRESVRVLRTLLAAIANAEAQPDADDAPMRVSDGAIAGAADGLAAAEVARRELDAGEVLAIVEAERDERLGAADDLAARGAPEAAASLRAEAAVVERYLG